MISRAEEMQAQVLKKLVFGCWAVWLTHVNARSAAQSCTSDTVRLESMRMGVRAFVQESGVAREISTFRSWSKVWLNWGAFWGSFWVIFRPENARFSQIFKCHLREKSKNRKFCQFHCLKWILAGVKNLPDMWLVWMTSWHHGLDLACSLQHSWEFFWHWGLGVGLEYLNQRTPDPSKVASGGKFVILSSPQCEWLLQEPWALQRDWKFWFDNWFCCVNPCRRWEGKIWFTCWWGQWACCCVSFWKLTMQDMLPLLAESFSRDGDVQHAETLHNSATAQTSSGRRVGQTTLVRVLDVLYILLVAMGFDSCVLLFHVCFDVASIPWHHLKNQVWGIQPTNSCCCIEAALPWF